MNETDGDGTAGIDPGRVLGERYRLDDLIGVGGMGEVWQGTDLLLDRTVAVKLLRPEYVDDEELVWRFRAEARHAGLLSHPNIAQVYDFRDARLPDPAHLVMEFVDGPSLATLLHDGPLGPARTMDVIAQAARGLAAAHRSGLVHRDVKPGNLLVRGDGQVKVSDFGIARVAAATPVTRTGVLPGTPAYMAPERAAGADATPAADLYALGVVAYQCLTGRLPFEGDALAVTIAHMEREVPPLPRSVPVGIRVLVADLTRKDPRARPSSADDVAARAQKLLAGLPLAAPATATRPDQRHADGAALYGSDPSGQPEDQSSQPDLLSTEDQRADGQDGLRRGQLRRWPPSWPNPRLSVIRPRAALAALVLFLMVASGAVGWVLGARSATPAARPSPPAARPTQGPSAQPVVTPVAAPATAPSRRPTPSPTPSASPTPSPSPTPAPSPTLSPSPSVSPSASPTPSPSPQVVG